MSPKVAPPAEAMRFALPPSLSAAQAHQLERHLAAHTGANLHVAPAAGYEELLEDMRTGRTHAAWAPPFLCARLEAQGLQVLVWGVRRDRPTYRAALVARAGAGLTLETLKGTAVAWVDAEATAGFLLPFALLKGHGLEPAQLFRSQVFLGTYRRALEAVRDGAADVAAVYCPPESTGHTWRAGVEEALPGESARFSLVAYTEEAPNAGVVLARTLPPAMAAALEQAFVTLPDSTEGLAVLRDVFSGMERFERAPRLSYRSLYRLAISSV